MEARSLSCQAGLVAVAREGGAVVESCSAMRAWHGRFVCARGGERTEWIGLDWAHSKKARLPAVKLSDMFVVTR